MSATLAADKVTSTPPFHGLRQVNILVLGTDVDFGCSRTDTIKFVHLDLDTQRISILSIPRDTWAHCRTASSAASTRRTRWVCKTGIKR